MRIPAKGVAWLLPFVLAGCIHSNNQQVQQPPLAPPIEDTPLPKPSAAPANLPPPEVTVPPPADTTATTAPQPPPKKPVKRKKPQTAAPAPTEPTQQASTESTGVSAIGQLSSGDPSSDLRQQTSDSIAATERGLNGINRTLNDQEQKTAVQIREWLKQAKDALAKGDVDGAHNLALKAKALLGELTQ